MQQFNTVNARNNRNYSDYTHRYASKGTAKRAKLLFCRFEKLENISKIGSKKSFRNTMDLTKRIHLSFIPYFSERFICDRDVWDTLRAWEVALWVLPWLSM